jgi:hypothetical protein
MEHNLNLHEGRGATKLLPRRTLIELVVELFERHAEDAVEGKRLVRRLVRVVTIAGITLVVLMGALVALVLHALIR